MGRASVDSHSSDLTATGPAVKQRTVLVLLLTRRHPPDLLRPTDNALPLRRADMTPALPTHVIRLSAPS